MLGNARRQKNLLMRKWANPAGSSSVLPSRLRSIARSARQAPDARDGEILRPGAARCLSRDRILGDTANRSS